MKIKFGLFIFIFGYILDFIGVWMKITHQAFGDITLAAAAIFKIVGLLLFTFMLLAHPKIKEFLEYDEFKDSF